MKEITIFILALLLGWNAFVNADSLVNINETTFSENLIANTVNLASIQMDILPFDNKAPMKIAINGMFFSLIYSGVVGDYHVISGGPSARYFISDKLFIEGTVGFGYYFSNIIDGLYFNTDVGLGIDFTIVPNDRTIYFKTNIGYNNINRVYLTAGLGFRLQGAVLGSALVAAGQGLAGGARNSGTSYVWRFQSGTADVNYNSFNRVEIENYSYSSITCNGKTLNNSSSTLYTNNVTISSNSNLDVKYTVSSFVLYILIK